ncbi:MAG: peptidase T, partial [Succinatimonas sp.]|nr:peptidase T [Succinatimonas sp.]
MNKRDELVKRFLRYVSIPSQSDASVDEVPSTKGQRRYAELLASELKDLGLCEISIDEHAAVYATLKGNIENAPCVGFVSHLDTVDVSLSPEVHPQIIRYEGGDVTLNKERNIVLKLSEHPELNAYVGDDIIFTDGTSVLGADNKAAGANIMTMLAVLKDDPSIKHGDLK